MNYYLDDLRTILSQDNVNLGYTGLDIDSIKVDWTVEASSLTSQENFITLESEGGRTDPTLSSQGDFSVYVYRTDPAAAGDDARIIHRYLNQYVGSLAQANSVHFKRIVTRQMPMPWHTADMPLHVFMFTMTALYNDTDLLRIT